MIDAQKLTMYYNAKHGSKSNPESNRMKAAIAKCEALGLETQDIIDYEKEHEWSDLCDGLTQCGPLILQWKTERDEKEAKQMAESVKEKAELGGAFGLVESVVATLITQQTPQIVELMKQEAQTSIEKLIADKYGSIPRDIKFTLPDKNWEQAQGVILDRNFDKILSMMMASKQAGAAWPLLVGPAGTGKSFTCEMLAEALGVPFYSINAVKEEWKLAGFIDSSGNYQETDFYRAWTQGGVFCLDEMDGSIAEVLTDLNGALAGHDEHARYPFPCGAKPMHPDFYFVACANTYGTGASAEYVGRFEQDAATRDRFAPTWVDYDPRVEERLTNNPDILTFVREFRKAVAKANMQFIVSYRAIKSLHAVQNCPNISMKDALRIYVLRNLELGDMHTLSPYISNDNPYGQAFKEIEKDMAEEEKRQREGR